MSTNLRTFCNSSKVFEDLFPKVNKHIQLNILLRKWEDKQRRTKKYKYEKFNHDGFLSNFTDNNVLYIINNKKVFFRLNYEMQKYIMKNTSDNYKHINASYMFLHKTNNKSIDINEYSRRYKRLILAEINILQPVLIVVLDKSWNIIRDMLEDKRNAEMTKQVRYTPILNLSPLDMSVATKKETLLFFKYLFDKEFLERR